MTTREKIEEQLQEILAHTHCEGCVGNDNWDIHNPKANLGVKETTQALLTLIANERREAEIEELNKLQELDNEYTRVGLQPGHRYLGFFNHINDRLNELSNNKEEE
jgi:hypothetical protein